MEGWVALHYRFPSRPSARRVYAWRKLRALGAVLLHDTVWVLPATARTREQLVWLAAEISELGGDAFLWEGELLLPAQASRLRQQFAEIAESEYQRILDALAAPDPDLRGLSDRYGRAQRRDYFQSALGRRVREGLLHHGQEGR